MDQHHGHPATPGPRDRRTRTRWSIRAATVIVPLTSYGAPLGIFAAFADDPNWADFWKTAATPYGTMTAGFAAITAAWIAYANGQAQRETDRDTAHQQLAHAQQQLAATTTDADRKHDAEIVRDLRTRFTTATQQLADPTHTIQQAGAYALASLADDWLQRNNTQEAQVCINVLCTYLRTHHLGTTDQPDGSPADQPVRDTIVRIIAEHLRANRDHAWSALELDFTGARLHNSDFSSVLFAGSQTVFDGAQFTGERTAFSLTHFTSEQTSFRSAHFTGKTTVFDEAQFTGKITAFDEAHFTAKSTSFYRTYFAGANTWFGEAQFTSEYTSFDTAQFTATITAFGEAQFTGENVSFARAHFTGGNTIFGEAQFTGENISFREARFTSEKTLFVGAHFSGKGTAFNQAQFTSGYTSFDEAHFTAKSTSFGKAHFIGGNIAFGRAHFTGENISFDEARFSARSTSFSWAQFTGENVSFARAHFSGETISFGMAYLAGQRTSFVKARFSAENTAFDLAQFGLSAVVDFSDPAAWENVRFDWDDDPRLKPENVLPTEWPPQVVEPNEPDTD